ncbi:MAG: SET domain-containing protein-lysine N-methyltransferase [Candidatus Pacearchaeota archaeon]|jgi:SET domain-containing protein
MITIKKSKIAGKGVFATRDIKKGLRICFMSGEEMDIYEMIRRVDETEEEEGSDIFQIDDEMYIDLDEMPRTINHSCDPNAFVRGKNELVALRDIKNGEEISYDYSTTMNDNADIIGKDYLWTCKCKCGASNCRKIIDQFKTLPKKKRDYYLDNDLVPDHVKNHQF